MAPRMHRDNYNTGDPSRYSLRTVRHCENNFLRARDVDVSKINGKEDFFRCIGLQMRKFQYQYKTPNRGQRVRKINIPHGVMLRDCRVVILASTCDLCGKCFKCETDLSVHLASKHTKHEENHNTSTKETQCTDTESELCETIPKPINHTTNVLDRNFETKLQKKLRITLRIGEEVVAKISVKRKHLKTNTVDMCTQTEAPGETELVADKDVHKSALSRIDPSLSSISPCQCCNSTMLGVNSPNQYFVSDIVANKQAIAEESATRVKSHATNIFKKSCVTSISENCCTIPHVPLTTLLPELNTKHMFEKCNPLGKNDIRNDSPDELSPVHSNNPLTINETNYDPQFTEKWTPISNLNTNNITSLTKGADSSLERIVQSDPKSPKEPEKEKVINANRIGNDSEKEKQSHPVPNMVQVIMPVILPIIVPTKSNASSPLKLTIQPISLVQQQQAEEHKLQEQNQQSQLEKQQNEALLQQHQKQELHQERQKQELHQEQQKWELLQEQHGRRQEEQQQIPNTSIANVGDHDNEVKEVLRIVRGRTVCIEINHESPNRCEQEILVQDAIRDMKRMEEQGWHLLGEDRSKRRGSVKSNTKSIDRNEECAKKKRRVVHPNFENDVVRSPAIEKCISDKKEYILRVQNYNNPITMCAKDSLKENLITYNRTMDIPREVLRQYGINDDNEAFEINNNTESMQESVDYFPVLCSGTMENRSNRPTVIDLVNDTDE